MVGPPKWRNHGNGAAAPRGRRGGGGRDAGGRGRVSVQATASRPKHRAIQLLLDQARSLPKNRWVIPTPRREGSG